MSESSDHQEAPRNSQDRRPRSTLRLSTWQLVGLVVLGIALVHSISRIIVGDEMGQLELALILFIVLFGSFPVLTRALSRSRVGQFIRADQRSTPILSTKRFKLLLQHDTNSFVVAQVFVGLLFLLILIAVAVAAIVSWIAS